MAMGILHTIDTILTVMQDHKEVRWFFIIGKVGQQQILI